MIETTIQLKPRAQWRPGMTSEKIKQELNRLVRFPGLTNAWMMPIKSRIDMQATGIKTPVGIKVAGPELDVIQGIGQRIEEAVKQVPGTVSVYSERVADVQEVIRTAVGGLNVGESVVPGIASYRYASFECPNLRF
jgi:copper/silver efflux system protein